MPANMKYKSFDNLPVVRPATAVTNNFQDSLLKATSRTAAESERLDKILEHYEKDYEEKS